MKPNAWDVMKHLGESDSRALKLAPMSNVLRVQKTKHGTQVTIGVGEDIVAAIANGTIVGGFLYCDRDVWRATEAALADAPPAVNAHEEMLEELRSVERGLLANIHDDGGSAGPDPQPPEPATERDFALVALLVSVRAVIAKAEGR